MVAMTFHPPLARPGQEASKDAARQSGPYAVAVVRDWAGFEALAPAWRQLEERCGRGHHVFQTYNWNWHWARHFLAGRTCNASLAIVCLQHGAETVGIWPLVLVSRLGFRVLHWMGEPVSQYGDVLIDPAHRSAAVLKFGWQQAMRMSAADALHLRKVRSDADTVPWLQVHRARITQREQAPYLDLASAPTFEAFEERYSAKSRKNRRRLYRRLQGLGEVRIDHFRAGSDARAAARDAIDLKRRTLDDAGRLAVALQDPRFKAFFQDAAEGSTHACGCRVTRLSVAGHLVASSVDVNFKAYRAAHIIVHDPEFAACGPGLHLIEDWLRTAYADGVARLDLLAPAHAYKWDWADGAVDVNDYAMAASLPGQLFVALLAHARPRLKAIAELATRWRRTHRHPHVT